MYWMFHCYLIKNIINAGTDGGELDADMNRCLGGAKFEHQTDRRQFLEYSGLTIQESPSILKTDCIIFLIFFFCSGNLERSWNSASWFSWGVGVILWYDYADWCGSCRTCHSCCSLSVSLPGPGSKLDLSSPFYRHVSPANATRMSASMTWEPVASTPQSLRRPPQTMRAGRPPFSVWPRHPRGGEPHVGRRIPFITNINFQLSSFFFLSWLVQFLVEGSVCYVSFV